MKNCDAWRPTKFVRKNGRLRASRDPKEVGVGSRMIADLIAERYDTSFKLHARGRLLDLGCGKVPFYDAYRQYVSENTCVDWANTVHKNDHLDFEVDLTKELPFADGEFDTIVLSDVLEHIPEPDLLCREMARVLASQGKLLMNVPFYYWLHEQPHDFYRYTEFALRRFMERSGMQVLQLQAIAGAPEIVVDVFAKNIVRVPVVGAPVAMLSQWIAATVARTSLGRRLSADTSSKFPLGYFLVAEKAA
jgi:SAM-dependent methyltransferase